jgi:serine/threonine protein kinase
MPEEQPTLPPPDDSYATLPPSGEPAQLTRPGCVSLPHTLGRYRLERLLGQGGMGAVYQAFDTQLGRMVALKIPFLAGKSADATRRRFLREAQSAAALSHPNICPVHDIGEIEGVPYLTMAFLDGRSLARHLGGKPIDVREAVVLTRKIALALNEAHSKGVIHRDLKPANIMLDGRGEPVVMDFGLARRADSVLQLTQQGEMMGTPAYMPPEQINGDVATMGPACDVWSLGMMLYEMLTGRLPFTGDLFALLAQITADAPAPPSRYRAGLDPRLDAVCLRAMAKSPADRWPSMKAFAEALNPFVAATVPLPHLSPLSLRVLGTPFAYRPLPGQAVIRLGRQKRRPGEAPEAGNDVVLRVPNDDDLSARISRQHLAILQSDGCYAVVDYSKAGTLLNGAALTREVPVELADGDQLVVAGVVTLQVDLADRPARAAGAEVSFSAGAARVVLEATLGDMVTTE